MHRGFILLETIVALLLIGLAIFPLAAAISHARHMQRLSELRLQVEQKLDEYQNVLLSLAQAHADVQPGNHERRETPFIARWHVLASEENLRAIRLTVAGNRLQRVRLFYKSQLIEEVIHGQGIRRH